MDTKEADDNALRRANYEMWYDEANEQFQRGNAWILTAEDNAHLRWIHPTLGLVFVWSGRHEDPIEVLHEHSEGKVIWRFEYNNHRPNMVVSGTISLVYVFKMTCERWISAREDAR